MQADSPLVTYVYEASNYGGGHNPNIVCIHDVEAPLDNGFARSLIGPNWFGGPAPTSTHYLVGPDDICQGVPESRVAWHCGTGNPRSIAIEQCGYARYSLAEWNSPKGRVQQENVAKLLADINRRRPLVRLRWLSNSELRSAWNNPGSPGGIVTHDQMRATLGGTTHYDPMNRPGQTVSYPLQAVINRAVQIRTGNLPEGELTVSQIEDIMAKLTVIEQKTESRSQAQDIANRVADTLAADPVKAAAFWDSAYAQDALNRAFDRKIPEIVAALNPKD